MIFRATRMAGRAVRWQTGRRATRKAAELKLKGSDLIAWLTSPKPDRGIRLGDSANGWTELPYADLADSALRIAAALRAEGVRAGDVVCVILETGADCLATLFGVQAAGAVMCPIVPPFMQPGAEYVAHTS